MIALAEVNRSDLARKTGLTTGGVSRILSGKRSPSVRTVRAIALELGVSVDDLLASLPT